uniref:Uncharacterized protein n=1 Tax=Anguilla anguilla TaxID=7936 RepID=A0A0E9U9E5_ANGAN
MFMHSMIDSSCRLDYPDTGSCSPVFVHGIGEVHLEKMFGV